MIYLTYNDLPSGIFQSQVIDVCHFISNQFNPPVRLVSFISLKGFLKNRKVIKSKYKKSFVLPMFPKHSTWKLNRYTLQFILLFSKEKKIIARGVFATNIALSLKEKGKINKVVFDARGAYKAEFEEYLNKIVHINDDISLLERKAIEQVDFRLAVSQKLVAYWEKQYNYHSNKHVVIPCTLSYAPKFDYTSQEIQQLREKLGYTMSDIIIIYSGSTADWQSPKILDGFLVEQLKKDERIKVILLSKFDLTQFASYTNFGNRMEQKWVGMNEVNSYLTIADYGLLIREDSITNEVASPVKFAEYLNAGLKIIVSENIGDYSNFVTANNLGYIYTKDEGISLEKVSFEEKIKMNAVSLQNFRKENFIDNYKKIIQS
ncbi:MAG: hypothetical protein JNL69_08855 [Bacteroidia bacterium]|nr:hypothetical protein [Bacteroidia bacterium]